MLASPPGHSLRPAARQLSHPSERQRPCDSAHVNVLKGTVKTITEGAVNTEVVVELPGGQEIVSMITKSSARIWDWPKGKSVYSVIKASSVILAVE